MNQSEPKPSFDSAWESLPNKLKGYMIHLARFPTEENMHFIHGYVEGLKDMGQRDVFINLQMHQVIRDTYSNPETRMVILKRSRNAD